MFRSKCDEILLIRCPAKVVMTHIFFSIPLAIEVFILWTPLKKVCLDFDIFF